MKTGKWYETMGNEGDVAFSTRVRLARNLAQFPFPARLDEAGRRRVTAQAQTALQELLPELRFIDMAQLPRTQALSLAERWLISPAFAQGKPGGALLLNPEETVSIMLCEEDHIRLQVLQAGLALQEAYRIADQIDSALGARLSLAFDEQLGYLTQCPTNLGTAMRASVELHLPALTALGRVARLGEGISKLGLTIRGTHGEGSEAQGALYQLSNQITLGITEEAALENLQAITLQIAEQERRAAAELLRQPQAEDQVWRAYGILQSARRMESQEALRLLSLVRMGAVRGLLPVKKEAVHALLPLIQPATLSLQNAAGEQPAAQDRDALRAAVIRERLAASGSKI
ncbi:MAG: protein arginine kinase [Oscillospiraceae bacterium]|jgi:protein arginine kinase|nr:protein arginine kinase [Oscillospiraceae bacterium]